MGDLVSELKRLVETIKSLDGTTVVHNSQQTYGTLADKPLTLKDRLSKSGEGAATRQYLEQTKAGMTTPEDTAIDDALVEMWADDIIEKALNRIFGV